MAEPSSEFREEGLQAQMDGEPAKYYDGYLIYRNLGADRRIIDAYEIFREKYPAREYNSSKPKVSVCQEPGGEPVKKTRNSEDVPGQFRLMVKKYRWAERAADHDSKLSRITLDRQVSTEKDDFLDRIALAQKMLQESAFKSIAISQTGLELTAQNMAMLESEAEREGSVKPSRINEVSRTQLTVLEGFEKATALLKEVMGIADIRGAIEQINKRAN